MREINALEITAAVKRLCMEANSYLPPSWFYKEVTFDASFSNSNLSTLTKEEIKKLMREAID